jgi:putative endonuclease
LIGLAKKMEEFFVYVLFSATLGRTYTGHTGNLVARLFRHNAGLERSTKGGVPWVLIYKDRCGSRSGAMIREKELKSGKGRDLIRQFHPGSPPRRTKD